MCGLWVPASEGALSLTKGLVMESVKELTWSDVTRYVQRCIWRRVNAGVVNAHDVDELVQDVLSHVWERNTIVNRETLPSCVTRAISTIARHHGVRGADGKIVRLYPISVSPDRLTRADNTILDELCAVTAEESESVVQELIHSVSPRSAALLLLLQDGKQLAPACEALALPRTSATESLRSEVRAFYAAD